MVNRTPCSTERISLGGADSKGGMWRGDVVPPWDWRTGKAIGRGIFMPGRDATRRPRLFTSAIPGTGAASGLGGEMTGGGSVARLAGIAGWVPGALIGAGRGVIRAGNGCRGCEDGCGRGAGVEGVSARASLNGGVRPVESRMTDGVALADGGRPGTKTQRDSPAGFASVGGGPGSGRFRTGDARTEIAADGTAAATGASGRISGQEGLVTTCVRLNPLALCLR